MNDYMPKGLQGFQKGHRAFRGTESTQFTEGMKPWNKGVKQWEGKIHPRGMLGKVAWNKGTHGISTGGYQKGHIGYKWMLGKKHSEIAKAQMSRTRTDMWKDSRYAKRMFLLQGRKPNQYELYVDALLQLNFPHEWRYVGDGQVWIEHKNPDFIDCNGKKLIIEYDGYFMHKYRPDTERDEIFARYGYKTLHLKSEVIKDVDMLIRKVREFME